MILVGLPATHAAALEPRLLIPCAYGSSGTLNLAAGVYTVDGGTLHMTGPGVSVFGTLDGNVAVFTFDSLSSVVGANIVVVGPRPVALLSRGSMTLNGNVTVQPGAGGGAAGGPAGTAGSGPGGGGAGAGTAGGGGGGFGGIGGTGAFAGGPGGPIYGDFLLSTFGAATSSGSGGGGASVAGGAGGGTIALVANTAISVSGTVSAIGQAGTNAVAASGGGGGGSGGAVFVRAPEVNILLILAHGGAGGNAAGSLPNSFGGGGGGGGGRILYSTNSLVAVSNVAGGPGGTSIDEPAGLNGGTGTVAVRPYKLKVPQFLPAVVRTGTQWHLRNQLSDGAATVPVFSYGAQPLAPILGDWDGDGIRTPGTFEAGTFKLRNSNSAGAPNSTFTFGHARGFPVVGDWNGDGLDDVAVYRNGTWQTRLTGCETTSEFSFGTGTWPAAVPVAGDWNGDGISGIGTYTPGTGVWALRQTPDAGAADNTFVWPGGTGFYPVTGDWDTDGDDSIGVKLASGTAWSLRNANSAGAADITFDFGLGNDLPLTWGAIPT